MIVRKLITVKTFLFLSLVLSVFTTYLSVRTYKWSTETKEREVVGDERSSDQSISLSLIPVSESLFEVRSFKEVPKVVDTVAEKKGSPENDREVPQVNEIKAPTPDVELKPTPVQLTESSSVTFGLRRLLLRVTPKLIDNSVAIFSSDGTITNHRREEEFATSIDIPMIHSKNIDCSKLFSRNDQELEKAKSFKKEKIGNDEYISETVDCLNFISRRNYILKAINKEEAEYSLAFSILVYDDIESFERLLRSIYRPQNFYCVHIDRKSQVEFQLAVRSIAKCFSNVFLPSRMIEVTWSQFSTVEAELICMEELLRFKKWRYFINLTGQEFPLKTNLDLVKILKVFNGSNNMEGTINRMDKERFLGFPAPPVNVTLTKGAAHIIVSRKFVKFCIKNASALKFREWVNKTRFPDETFFSSLNHSPQLKVPGAYLGIPETDMRTYPFLARFKNWGENGDGPFNWPCHGDRVRFICVFGVGDLALLASRPELFANKFYVNFEPLTLDCMEELHFNRTRDEMLGRLTFDTTFYEQFNFVKNHI